MKIIKVGFGNRQEAFIESNLEDGVNIIYSDENNKGKTLLMQTILFAMGNEAIFPSGFPVNNYYFYTEVDINNKNVKFLRRNNSIVTILDNKLNICNSIAEFKRFINDNLFRLPLILKDDKETIVDLMLYYQMFFIGQDKRNSSNIFNNGQYNKKDFLNMLYSENGYPLIDVNKSEKEIDEEIKSKRIEIKTLKKTMKFIKENPQIADFTNSGVDRENFEVLKSDLIEILQNILEYKKKRNRACSRKIQLETLLGELRAITINVKKGTVTCLNCGSKNISYSNGDISFDVSNSFVRKEIMKSIEKQISAENSLVEEYAENIEIWQNKLNERQKTISVDLKNILLYSEEILSSKECGDKISKLIHEIGELEKSKGLINEQNKETIKQNKLMLEKILEIMNNRLKELDPHSSIIFDDLFTKSNVTYSGSEEQEFYYCKILALNDYFKHQFPLIVDSYRDGEVSTSKERTMLDNYIKTNKQVILTSTLKAEEYHSLKYDEIENVNAIDYSIHKENKILRESYVEEFSKILDMFNVI